MAYEKKEFKFESEKRILQGASQNSGISGTLSQIESEMTDCFYRTFEYMMNTNGCLWIGTDQELMSRSFQALADAATRTLSENTPKIVNSYNLVFSGIKPNVEVLPEKITAYNSNCDLYVALSNQEQKLRAQIRNTKNREGA